MVGDQMVGILVFVDDVMRAGGAEEIRRAIRNFAAMETLKKFTYGLKKTNYMIIKTGREKDEEVVESVKQGLVKQVKEYNYTGIWLNETGNLSLQIERKQRKVKGKISALKSLASYHNVGTLFFKVRMEMYELCIVPSVLYNLEGWNQISKAEIKKLESIQHKALCSLLHLPKSTPYLGLLRQLGIWRMEEQLMYRKTMLYHNLMNSKEDRLSKKIVRQQQDEEDDDTFYNVTKQYFDRLNIDITSVTTMSKKELKNKLKQELNKRTINIIKKSLHMSKLRFLSPPEALETAKYLKCLPGTEALKALKTRLNMQPVYGNFKGDLSKPRLCHYCSKEDDTTEHLLQCEVLKTELEVMDLFNETDPELWLQINELIEFNLKNRE